MYTQNAYVEMSKSLIGKQAQVKTEGFKSYVHLFYSKRQPTDKPAEYNSMLLEEYVFAKKHLEYYWEGRDDYELIESKNGYLLLKKK
jgi:hypothetical protein